MSRSRSCSTSFVLALLVALGAGCASIASTTNIAPGTAFHLGGAQAGAFTVRGRNTGSVAVVVYSDLDGSRDSVLTLAPGAAVDARFPSRATAVFRNISTTTVAEVSIKVTGDVGSLGMRYEQARKP